MVEFHFNRVLQSDGNLKKNFYTIDIICLDDSLKYRIMAITLPEIRDKMAVARAH